MSSHCIAAVIVLYNPDENVIENIASYVDDVNKLYVVDNSDKKNRNVAEALQQQPKVNYIDNHGNRGIAHALNVGAKEALKDGYEYLLTMDQDSRAGATMIMTMLECINEINKDEAGIISPFHASRFHERSADKGCIEKTMVMTSGNLLLLKAYKETGPFREELFLDYVDNEYCLRLQKSGYKVIQASDAILHHNLGELSKHTLFGKNIFCYNYPPIRYYYRTRNVIYINRELAYFDALYFKELLKDIIKILLYESEKYAKLKHIFLGLRDGLRGEMGKYEK